MARNKQHNADLTLVLALFFVYAVCALLLCVLGANTYADIDKTMKTDYNDRTGTLYIAEKTRKNDIGGALRLDTYNGTDALVFVDQEVDTSYETWIFVANGSLMEYYVEAGRPIDLNLAESIMPMQSLKLTQVNQSLLNVALVSDDGTPSSISLAARSTGGTFNTGAGAAPQVPNAQADNDEASGPTIMHPPLVTILGGN